MTLNLKALIGKLNDTTRAAATRAASLCMAQGHHEVEVEHLMLALLEQPRCDLALIVRRCELSPDRLAAQVQHQLAQFRTGSTRTPVFSRQVPQLLEHAWLMASLEAQQPARIRSSHLLVALLTAPELAQLAHRAAPSLAQVPIDEIKHQLGKYTRGSEEADASDHAARPAGHTPADAPEQAGAPSAAGACAAGDHAGEGGGPLTRTPALDRYTTCLTALAREQRIDPVIGREAEVRQVVDILLRRRQNNPILTGEAGVGKTAVVEGLALRIAAGDVPAVLQDVEIHVLDMGLLQAGASVKGEFELRLKGVIDEVKASVHAIILFIDEAHTMIGAGGPAGQNDAANLLKPALARGELRTIAATTWSEYKKYFEKDAALARRFQVVKVEEPSEEMACAMLRAMAPLMERHFGVRIRDEAVAGAVRLSHRYISGRQLPDKAVSVLDTACARVALAQSGTPALLEAAAKEAERLADEVSALQREAADEAADGAADQSADQVPAQAAAVRARADHAGAVAVMARHGHAGSAVRVLRRQRLDYLAQRQAVVAAEQSLLSGRWQREQALVAAIVRARAEDGDGATRVPALRAELAALQGETPLVPLDVDEAAVAAIVSGWTGIPLGKMVKDEIHAVLRLHEALQERILGQPHAIAAVAQRVRTARASLEDPNKPKGVFLFVGPSGVGKTETALALADLLYGGERKLITINMSEYQEAHSVAGLKGSPPGYVGYGEGGVLTEAVRRNPYSVVLLDEIEKAHPDVCELFFQVFDKGVMDDAEGREIDFRNTILIATSNAGSATIMQACLNQQVLPTVEELETQLRPQLARHFKPAFLGRLKVVPFYPIADTVLAQIIEQKLQRVARRIRVAHQARFGYTPELVEAVLARCTEVDAGARNVDHVLNGTLLPEIAEAVLAHMAQGLPIAAIEADVDHTDRFTYALTSGAGTDDAAPAHAAALAAA